MRRTRFDRWVLQCLPAIELLFGICPSAFAEPLVVLDPGHGGAQTGAKNADGFPEKTIALEVAKHAQAVLVRQGVRVVLTRGGTDKKESLDARVQQANRLDATVFVSIHANSSPVRARRGCETYVLSADSSDQESMALVHLENELESEDTTAEGGRVPRREEKNLSDVDLILADLRRSRTHEESARLAVSLQEHLAAVPELSPGRGLRQAPFLLLRGVRMPAALVELGYLTHPAQGKLLATAEGQRRGGEAIGRGVLAFLAR